MEVFQEMARQQILRANGCWRRQQHDKEGREALFISQRQHRFVRAAKQDRNRCRLGEQANQQSPPKMSEAILPNPKRRQDKEVSEKNVSEDSKRSGVFSKRLELFGNRLRIQCFQECLPDERCPSLFGRFLQATEQPGQMARAHVRARPEERRIVDDNRFAIGSDNPDVAEAEKLSGLRRPSNGIQTGGDIRKHRFRGDRDGELPGNKKRAERREWLGEEKTASPISSHISGLP